MLSPRYFLIFPVNFSMKVISRFFYVLVLFCLTAALPLKAQTSLKAANRLYDLTDYARAIPIYKKLLKGNEMF